MIQNETPEALAALWRAWAELDARVRALEEQAVDHDDVVNAPLAEYDEAARQFRGES